MKIRPKFYVKVVIAFLGVVISFCRAADGHSILPKGPLERCLSIRQIFDVKPDPLQILCAGHSYSQGSLGKKENRVKKR